MIAEQQNSLCSYSYLPNCPQRVSGPKLVLFWDKLPSFLQELMKLFTKEAITICHNLFDLLAVNIQSISHYINLKVFPSPLVFFSLFRNYQEGTEPRNFWFKVSSYACSISFIGRPLALQGSRRVRRKSVFSYVKEWCHLWLKRYLQFCMLMGCSDTDLKSLLWWNSFYDNLLIRVPFHNVTLLLEEHLHDVVKWNTS